MTSAMVKRDASRSLHWTCHCPSPHEATWGRQGGCGFEAGGLGDPESLIRCGVVLHIGYACGFTYLIYILYIYVLNMIVEY